MAPFSRAERLFREASGRVEEPGGGSAEGREGDAGGERASAAAVPDRAALEAPPPIRWIVRTLEEAGYETWTVGGAVRDALVGRPGGDWDLATLARPRDVRRIFPRTVPIGVEHGTVGVLDRTGELHEVTTFRRDVETFGRHAVVEFAGTIEEDLARRDFTINALAWHPIRGELRDPFDGAADLRRRVLRTVGEPAERFAEDHLRVLRGLRFAGRFELRIEAGTWSALCAGTAWLRRLSAERIREELIKVLEGDERPSRALGLYAASGAVGELYPELEPTIDAAPAAEERAGPAGASEGIWENALLAVDALPAGRPLLRLTTLLAGAGESERVPGHDDGDLPEVERAARRSAAVMTRLRFSNADVDRVARLVRAGTVPPDPANSPEARRRWLSRHGPDLLPDLGRIWVARARVERCRGRPEAAERVVAAWRGLRTELRRDPPLTEADLALDGRDLIRMGLDPGPRFGEILEDLLDRVLEDPACNRKETLQRIVEERLGGDPEGDVGEGGG